MLAKRTVHAASRIKSRTTAPLSTWLFNSVQFFRAKYEKFFAVERSTPKTISKNLLKMLDKTKKKGYNAYINVRVVADMRTT